MNRRQYLARTGAVSLSTGLFASVAGCLGGLPGSSDNSDVTVSDRTGQRALDRAAGSLNTAAQSLTDLQDLENPEAVDFDPTEPRAHIETARGHLETAAATSRRPRPNWATTGPPTWQRFARMRTSSRGSLP